MVVVVMVVVVVVVVVVGGIWTGCMTHSRPPPISRWQPHDASATQICPHYLSPLCQCKECHLSLFDQRQICNTFAFWGWAWKMKIRIRIGFRLILMSEAMMVVMAMTSLVGGWRTCFELREGLIRANNSIQYADDHDQIWSEIRRWKVTEKNLLRKLILNLTMTWPTI